MRKTIAVTLISAMCLIASNVSAVGCSGPQRVSSGPTTVSVAELYTSEGCDSCPPADKWFSSLNVKKDGVVPLAFHVDYWDYIGWKDRFASAAFGERQRESVRRQGGRTSYTPQVMVDGRDLRRWSDQSQFSSSVKAVAARAPRADLSQEFLISRGGLIVELAATLPQTADRADAAVFFAITENNLSNRVTAGENRGATLRHDHVVRALFGPLSGESKDRAGGRLVIKRPIVLAQDWKLGDLTLVTFVQNLRTGEILQALSAPVCKNS